MGQTQYSPPPSSGGGGTNFWQLVAGVLSPRAGIGIDEVFIQFGTTKLQIYDELILLISDDGAGNTSDIQLVPTQIYESVALNSGDVALMQNDGADILLQYNDAAGNISEIQVLAAEILQSVQAASGANSFIEIQKNQIYQQVDRAGSTRTNVLDITDIDISAYSTLPSGTNSYLYLDPNNGQFGSYDSSGAQTILNTLFNSFGLVVQDATGNEAGINGIISQVNVGYRDSGGVAESLFVALPTSVLMYVVDAGGNIGEAIQDVANFGIQFNGASTFENNVDGFIYYDEFDPGAGAYVGYSGIMQIKDIGGTIYSIPYL